MAGSSAFVNKNVPLRFTSNTKSQSASLIRTSSPSRVIPALLTRISTLPKSARIWRLTLFTCSPSAVLTAYGSALTPSWATSVATFWAFANDKEQTATFAPSAANNWAMAAPIPRPAPVTTATFLSRSLFMIGVSTRFPPSLSTHIQSPAEPSRRLLFGFLCGNLAGHLKNMRAVRIRTRPNN